MDTVQLKSWYDRFYGSGADHSRPYHTYLSFIDYLEAQPGRRLLDVGCGDGRLLRAARERGLVAFGVDLSSNGAVLAKSFTPAAHVVVGNGERLPFPDDAFDYLTCLGSLEHLLDMEAGLKEIMRVCKADARVCIMVPNSFYLFEVIAVLRTGYRRHGKFQPQEKLATLGEWKDLLEAHGLTVLEIERDKEPIETSWRNVFHDFHPIRIVKRFIEKVLQAVMPVTLGYQFIFVCRKGEQDAGPACDCF
jgi:ubiquinone/menaquinone biosynthesis C-methylase UbiE